MERAVNNSLYAYIYNFLSTYLFNQNGLPDTLQLSQYNFNVGGVAINLNRWLCHTCSIAIMIIGIILCILLVRWVWRLVTSAFLLK